jgi:hypothetical protein
VRVRDLDVCARVPRDQVAAVLGSLAGAPRAAPRIGEEDAACEYRTATGAHAEIRLSPASRWEILEAIQGARSQRVAGVGRAALTREAATERFLYARGDRVMVQVAVSKGPRALDQARALADLALRAAP